MKTIYAFKEKEIPAITEVGGKAHSLITMTNAGFNVPEGFVCGASFFKDWTDKIESSEQWSALQDAIEREGSLERYTNDVKDLIKTFELSEEQENQMKESLKVIKENSLYAVRSSSPEEDLEGSSFAGIYETVLGVKNEGIKKAILDVFLSAFDERVFVYKKAKGFLTGKVKIAVVVMEQINSDSAGVGFSVNPINNDYDEAAINANFGLGESVVGGIVSPDYFIMNKLNGSVIDKALGNKKKSVYLGSENSGGTSEKENQNVDSFSITDEQAKEITEMIVKVEKLYKLPMDIEWTYSKGTLYMIQGRPITTYIPIPEAMKTDSTSKKRVLYYDCSVVEGVTTNKPITPMTRDWTINDLGNAMMGPYIGKMKYSADGDPKKDIFFGKGVRIYMNFSQLFFLDSPKTISKSFKQVDVDASEALANLDSDVYLPEKSEKFPYLHWKVIIPFVFKSLFRAHRPIWDWIDEKIHPVKFYDKKYEPLAKKVLNELEELREFDISISDYREKTRQLLTDYSEVFMPIMINYAQNMNAIRNMFGDDQSEKKDLADHLTMGIEGDESVSLGIDLYKLSKLVPKEEFNDIEKLSEKCKNQELSEEFMKEWDKFVEKHGIRGPNEMEIANHRYQDDPSLAFSQMSTMLDVPESPEVALNKHVKEREAAYQKLMKDLDKKDAKKLKEHYELVHKLSPSRNTLKYIFVQINFKLRHLALDLGKKLADEGRINKKEDVFFLTFDELEKAQKDSNFDFKDILEKREEYFEHATMNIQNFPIFIDSRGRIISAPDIKKKSDDKDDDPNVLHGNGISRGVARGKVKVFKDPREKKIEKGDILVTYNTDPGWTPLFIGAEGIILEVGAVLQHGGLVAREYAKPCVAGIRGITEKLKDGQMVEVDGTNGIVKILE